MQLLKTIKHSDLFPAYGAENKEYFRLRKVVRAVVFDSENKIAILKVARHNYHTLPGGGIEDGESMTGALEREMLEEIGCNITAVREVGKIIEYRDEQNLQQETFYYMANLVGEKGKPNFTQGEIYAGFEIKWVSLDEAMHIMKNDQPDNYDGKFIKVRDLCFLEEVRYKK